MSWSLSISAIVNVYMSATGGQTFNQIFLQHKTMDSNESSQIEGQKESKLQTDIFLWDKKQI